jgi:putative transposase
MHTYEFKIKTNKTLVERLENQLSITRLVYNLAKETKETAYSKGVKLSKFDLIKQLPELKKEFTWISTVNAQTLQSVIERLDNGYKKFFSDLTRGVTTSKPHWAKKRDWSSVEFKQGNVKQGNPTLRFENESVFNLPKIGKIKIFKSREVEGNIKLARVVKRADGWYLQIVTDYTRPKSDNQAEVGIDLGIKHFVVTSDGQFFENIKTTKKYADKLAEAQRKLSLKTKGSKNFYRELEKVKRVYLKIQRVREDYLHKVSRELANNYQYVFAEDLDIKEMVKNKNYSKSISDVSWGKLLEYLEYKTNVIKVDAKYSSQECNNCGHISKENRPNQETFKCVKCRHEGNADFEASLTIKKRGQSLLKL